MEEVKYITAEGESFATYFTKVWKNRSLAITFARRDLKIKYAQTFFGVFWILLQPIPSIVIFTFFFGRIMKVDTGKLPYPLFALMGMIGWNYFTNLSSGIGTSLIESQHILKKIYFPKLILSLAKILVGGVDFLVSFGLILVAFVLYQVIPDWKIIFFPLFLLLNILAGFSVGIWVSALTFKYRDFQHIAPYLINFSIWLTPVFYPTTVLPQNLSKLMYFNPMAFVVTGYRYTLVGDKMPSPYFLLSIIPVLILFVAGLWYFRRIEDEIADYI